MFRVGAYSTSNIYYVSITQNGTNYFKDFQKDFVITEMFRNSLNMITLQKDLHDSVRDQKPKCPSKRTKYTEVRIP